MRGLRRSVSMWSMVAAAAATLALAGAGIAAANVSAGPGNNNAVPASRVVASPHVTTCTHLWAVVRADGTLARAGCKGTKSASEGTGVYQVLFPRVVRNCAYLATIGKPSATGTAPPGVATVAGRNANKSGVWIATFDMTGAPLAQSFHLAVSC